MSGTEGRQLEDAFAGVAENYRGQNIDLYPIYREMRKRSPIIAEDFMSKLGVPNIAGHDPDRPTFTKAALNLAAGSMSLMSAARARARPPRGWRT